MTRTSAGLRSLAAPHTRARILAASLVWAGVALVSAALGLALAPRPAAVVLAWVGVLLALGGGWWLGRRARRGLGPQPVGRLVESAAGARAGSVVGPAATRVAGTSAELWDVADARAAAVVTSAAPAVHGTLGRATRGRLLAGAAIAALGAMAFVAAAPGSGRAAAFWHPLRTLRDARSPVRLVVDRPSVRRGETVTALITVPAATRAVLWTRGAGETWQPQPLALDSTGRASVELGPLDADLYMRAASGTRRSPELRVEVRTPAFLADLALTARFPAYIERGDEPLVAGPDTITLPAGTAILARGAASVALADAGWVGSSGRRVPLGTSGSRFDGRFTPQASGTWRLELAPATDGTLEGEAPSLVLRLVADSAPVVAVPVPGRDTTLPITLRQPLVIDAHDDHGLSRLAIVSWRASQTGRVGAAVRESLDVRGAGDRAILQTELALESRGLLPGDTLRFYVEAVDNAPRPGVGRSPEFALRLPTRAELRAAAREAAADVAAAADSVAAAQAELGDRTRDLAQERSRDPTTGSDQAREGRSRQGALPFQATQRAEEVARQQAELAQRVEELSQAVEDIGRAMQAAGLDDTAFQARLREVQSLLDRAITPEMAARLRELQEALQRLDPDATRAALERLAEAQRRLREELERSEELFRRAAIEGSLSSLAEDARELRERQQEWNRAEAPRADSAAAAAERALAARADSLAAGVQRAQDDLRAGRQSNKALDRPRDAAARAGKAMRRAESRAAEGEAAEAGEAGEEAAAELADLPEDLLQQRDSLAGQWRRETLAALDRAMSEAAALAERQQRVAEELRRGEGGSSTRSRQGSVEEGTQAVERQIRDAAGRNALVSPQLEGALSYAQRQMRAARQQLEQGTPNTGAAAQLADQALDALNATAHALARSRSAVAGSQSGSGMPEAIEQLARMAQAQQGVNQDANSMMPGLGQGEGMMQQMRDLAARQRALAEQLERMRASGAGGGAEAMAQEARELARRLEAGRLDRQTVERQERLYRRMLDAGRTLTGPEPDDEKERTSRTATADELHRPPPLAPGATGPGARVRYPTWEELRALSPTERRLVLEYFRLLNAPRQ